MRTYIFDYIQFLNQQKTKCRLQAHAKFVLTFLPVNDT